MFHISDIDVLEWTMGWFWPVIVLLGILMAWGIGRFLTWDEKEGEQGADAAGQGCVCYCEAE